MSCYCKTEGLAWDWIGEKLYWTDTCDNDIEVFDPATGDRKVLISTGSNTDPRGIVLDPTTRYAMSIVFKIMGGQILVCLMCDMWVAHYTVDPQLSRPLWPRHAQSHKLAG